MKQEAYCPGCKRSKGIEKFSNKIFGWKCLRCENVEVGEEVPEVCRKCENDNWENLGEYNHPRPSQTICETCQAEIDLFEKIMEEGGIKWRCQDCGNEGVFEHNHPLAIEFKKLHDPKVAGVLVESENCPACRKLTRALIKANMPLPAHLFKNGIEIE